MVWANKIFTIQIFGGTIQNFISMWISIRVWENNTNFRVPLWNWTSVEYLETIWNLNSLSDNAEQLNKY